ncbi:MAG TPA: TonB-dependent receptor, partial [Pseudomonas sp.]|nr:TonB-dependent receptor [Pseudomonas sp.]
MNVVRHGGRLPVRTALSLAVAALTAGLPALAAEPLELAQLEVVSTTLQAGVELPRDQFPANIQTLDAERLQRVGGLSLADQLQRTLPSVNVNDIQGNPYQANLNYRGFTASPLLGTPQGLSVFLDGVRVNEPFGDVVNWDLIPHTAIADLALMPGSNPLYGLNTLGGALALQTKRGDTHPGGALELYDGSFGRRGGSVEHGGKQDAFSWYVAAEGMKEDGWRDHSPSEVGQLFGKFAWTTADTDLALTVAHADNELIGNGLVPERLAAQRRSAIFTHPDRTDNRSTLLALSGSQWLNERDRLSGTLYLRRTLTHTLNGDLSNEYAEEYDAWADAGFPAGEAPESGVLNRTRTDQQAAGLALQWSRTAGAHQFAVGASHDNSKASFRQSAQAGTLTDDRGIAPLEDELPLNSLLGRTRTTSLYATDTVSLTPNLQVTGSLRYNRTRVINHDRMGDDLDGDFTYRKLNPALGFSWQASPDVTLYGGFTQGNRAPTPIELGCADPLRPCSLPNAMAADPFLKQVVTQTFELGLRGRLADHVQWNASVFRSTNKDDILFVGTGGSRGYFTNFGRTRREGVELGLSGDSGAFDWHANYSYLRATYRSSACILAENNSTAGQDGCPEDEIRIASGDRLPGLPSHSLKLGLGWQASDALHLGAELVAYSWQYVRGNENNRH